MASHRGAIELQSGRGVEQHYRLRREMQGGVDVDRLSRNGFAEWLRNIEMVRRKSVIEHGLCSTLQEQIMLRKYLLCENECIQRIVLQSFAMTLKQLVQTRHKHSDNLILSVLLWTAHKAKV